LDPVTVEPGKCGGKPCILGMRITVRRVLELLAAYQDRDSLFAEYPFLEPEDLQQALRHAAAAVDDELLSIDRVAREGFCLIRGLLRKQQLFCRLRIVV
jgi:uncharacterized protein (DUF433 family)